MSLYDNNLDERNLHKFGKIHSWTQHDKTVGMLQEINFQRLTYIKQKITHHFATSGWQNLTILDVGCGGGLVTTPLAKLGAKQVVGIDPEDTNIHYANRCAQAYKLDNLAHFKATAQEQVVAKQQYDIVLCLEVLEHVPDIELLLGQLIELVNPKGMLILSTINRNLKSRLLAIFAAEYILRWVTKGTHEYDKFIQPAEIEQCLNKYGWNINHIQGLEFYPFKGWYLSDNIAVNYLVYATKT